VEHLVGLSHKHWDNFTTNVWVEAEMSKCNKHASLFTDKLSFIVLNEDEKLNCPSQWPSFLATIVENFFSGIDVTT